MSFDPENCEECATRHKYNERLKETVAIREQLQIALEALGNTRDYFYVAGEEWREPYRWAIKAIDEIKHLANKGATE